MLGGGSGLRSIRQRGATLQRLQPAAVGGQPDGVGNAQHRQLGGGQGSALQHLMGMTLESGQHHVLPGPVEVVAQVAQGLDAGAVKVYLASAAPPVRHPNVYGIDMPTRTELVAHNRTVEEIRQVIGADALIYQDVDAMKQTVGMINPKVQGFEASCFDGVYITGDISDEEVTALNEGRQRGGEDEAEDTSRLSLPNAQES